MPTALVTGGAGFIGSHLVDRLINEGFEVRVLDNFSTGKLENIHAHLGNPRFHLFKGDIRRKRIVKEVIKGIDYVFHLAAVADIKLSMRKPKLVNDINVAGTLNLLEESLSSNVEKFIFTSSCAVYGEPIYTPIDENHPTNPISPYGVSKLAAEHYCRVFYEIYGLKTVVLRLFNVYGPRQERSPYRGVIAEFLKRLKKGNAPIIFGSGEQTRDFIYVADVVEALMLTLKSKLCAGVTLNIGSGVETSINEIAEKLIEIFGLKIRPIHLEARAGDVKRSCANINRAKETLGFKVNVPLEDGLKICIKEYAGKRENWGGLLG